MIGRALAKPLIWLVVAYQATVSKVMPPVCRFEPSCSRYAKEALERHGAFRGGWLAVRRLSRVDLSGSGTGERDDTRGGIELRLRSDQLDAVLRALERQGEVRVLSSPSVATLNNQRAIINVSTDEVFFAVSRVPIVGPTGATIGFQTQVQPQQIAVGIVLDVVPQIGPDNTITMNIRPVVTDLLRVETLRLDDGTQAQAPVIDRRETDTMARVRAGETIAIGGLMRTKRDVQVSGVPLLKDIPLLGRLFRSTRTVDERRELVIFITPTILASSPAPGR